MTFYKDKNEYFFVCCERPFYSWGYDGKMISFCNLSSRCDNCSLRAEKVMRRHFNEWVVSGTVRMKGGTFILLGNENEIS